MARQTLTKTNAPGGYSGSGTAVTMTAADATNKEEFVSTGRELVIAQNTGVGARTVTINSVDDSFGRAEDITAESIAAGAIRVYGPFPTAGWQQSGGKINLEASHAEVKWGIIVLP